MRQAAAWSTAQLGR
jgi:hypothetical protein